MEVGLAENRRFGRSVLHHNLFDFRDLHPNGIRIQSIVSLFGDFGEKLANVTEAAIRQYIGRPARCF